ncbi:MAG: SMC family ATPase [Treponema sp.]|nr:SMC family ATPase [Treponema sp.]
MRPLKVIITGFEAYINKCEIDFTAFGDGTLYLITGNTGAGKTTIFDAITYALYGEASGTSRDEKMLRTVTVGPETPTEVDFTFEFKKKKYRILRNPEYVGLGKNNRTKKITGNATLWDEDGNVLADSKTSVRAYIEKLLGLTKNQFCRIAMIAQGDFYSILNADTTKRKELYSKIFGTDLFNILQKRISEETQKAKAESEDLNRQKNQIILDISLPEGYDESLFSPQSRDEELNGSIRKLLEHDSKNQEDKEKEVEKINREIKEREKKLSDGRKLAQQKKSLEDSKEKLKKEERELEEAKVNLEKEMARQGEIDRLASKYTLINESLSKYDSLEEKKSALNKNIASIKSKSEKEEELKKQNELLSQAIESASEKIKSYSGLEVEIEKCSAAKEKITQEGKKLSDAINQIKNLEELQKQNQGLKEEYSTASDKAQKAAEEYQGALKAFLDAQAGIIAKELEEGKPCPVCGSIHHPTPAVLSQKAPDQSEVDSLKEQSQKLENAAKEKSIEAGNMDGQVKSKREEIEARLSELNVKGDIQSAAKELEEKCSGLRTEYLQKDRQLKTLSQNLEEKKSLQEKIEGDQKKLEEAREMVHTLQTEIAALKSSVNENEKAIRELESSLTYSDKRAAQNAAKEIQEKINEIKGAQEKARAKLDWCSQEISTLKGIISEQEKSIAELTKKVGEADLDIDKEERALNDLVEKEERIQDELDEIKIRLAQNKAGSEKLKKLQEKLGKIHDTYRWMNDLDLVAGGKIRENGRIDLETYVQISIFDRILIYANQRLGDIAGNQYRLVRKQKSDDNRSGFALDLDIQDNFSDKVRPVQGLSGGETFEASLALALGLSDEIQANAGGIELDCMFIDEGFGSLSEEPLDKAVNTLYSLAQGKKLVGIISHVERLNGRIDDKIEVTKDPVYGSSAKVVTSKI